MLEYLKTTNEDRYKHLIGELGPTDGPEIDGVMSANLVLPVIGQHLAVPFAIVPARKVKMVELQVETELRGGRLHDAQALRHYFLADAVPCDDGDTLLAHRCFPVPDR